VKRITFSSEAWVTTNCNKLHKVMNLNRKQEKSSDTLKRQSLRLLPGVIIVVLQWLLRFVVPMIEPKAMIIGIFSGLLGGVAILVWWLFFSRAPRIEKWGALVLIILSLYVTSFLIDESISRANMGLMFIIHSIPVMSLAFVFWVVVSSRFSVVIRRVTMIITILLASGIWIFLRTNGMTGDGRQILGWRWAKTSEERLLTQTAKYSSEILSIDTNALSVAEWPGFRGRSRDGIVKGTNIRTDWSVSPPVELWRRPVGPGCSSFAVHGNLLYTQEQRGEYEAVSCYNLTDGKPLWVHQDKARFYEPHAGAGPRSTPILSENHIYTLGATGILNAMDRSDGSVIWSRNAVTDAGVKIPDWGITSSPLVLDTIVVVALAGKLAAFDKSTGEPVWYGPDGGSGYSSPQFLILNGVPQVIHMSKTGAVSVEPNTGKTIWEYPWEIQDRILQPSIIEGGDLLFSGENKSIRRISIMEVSDGYSIREIWNSNQIKVNFNDFVIHKGFAYGFDGPYLTCIDLSDGMRKWRGDRYRGFTLLLADQDVIVVLTEKGEVALVQAAPEKFIELSRFQALNGKTWSHPVIAGNILVVRNAQEMAAFRLQ